MFARTERLTLRPSWIEDAPALAHAMSHWDVVSKLSRAPWPYGLQEAVSFLSMPADGATPVMSIHLHEAVGNVRLIGGIGIHPDERGELEFGYWLTPDAWGRGYATEAGHAVIAMARDTLRLKRLSAGHFIDNPASGKVLRKLGFRPTGRIVPRHSRARGHDTPCALFELDLSGDKADFDPDARMAA